MTLDATLLKVGEIVAQARETLRAGGVPPDEAAGDAEFLARHALGFDLTQYALARNELPSPDFPQRFAALIARRLRREPVSQIVGYREFWGLDFEVTRDVLTPRPETELVIEAALEAFQRDAPIVILDIGTGSGCLAIALATEFPAAMLIASDISLPALAVARRNAARHGVQNRIAFLHTRELAPENDVDLIVSNPPYVPLRDEARLAVEVRDYEPRVALFGGPDGLDIYRGLLHANRQAIAVGDAGRLIVEVGYGQAADVTALARAARWERERVHRDLQGIDRVLTFRAAPREDTSDE
jgi:release factor glutamine methyltransferase